MGIRSNSMSNIETVYGPLVMGDKLTADDFLRRWEAVPDVKKAELIGGIVYMPSPLSAAHGTSDGDLAFMLRLYTLHTPGTEQGSNATWLMLEDAPQPDMFARILEAHGGQSRKEFYFHGAPELVVEICHSSSAYDVNQKMDLYRQAGVQEYVVWLLREREIRWHRLVGGRYEVVPPDADGLVRSRIFPGLWLDARALLDGRFKDALSALERGLAAPEHAAFVAELERRKR